MTIPTDFLACASTVFKDADFCTEGVGALAGTLAGEAVAVSATLAHCWSSGPSKDKG